MSNQCQECKTFVMWLRNKKTKNPAPIEVAPSDHGNLLIKGLEYRVATKEEIEKAKEIGKPLYLNHYATCPKAGAFRKRKKEDQ